MDKEPEYLKLREQIKTLKDSAEYERNGKQKLKIYNEILRVLNVQKKFLDGYKPMPYGFGMMHVFRKKNKQGATVLDSMYFHLDSNYTIRPEEYYYLLNK